MRPSGTYAGTVHGPLWLRLLGKAWGGKTFTGDRVTNRIFGVPMISGDVSVHRGIVYIHYPRLHVTDELFALFDDGSRWAGELKIGRWTVLHFTLSRDLQGETDLL